MHEVDDLARLYTVPRLEHQGGINDERAYGRDQRVCVGAAEQNAGARWRLEHCAGKNAKVLWAIPPVSCLPGLKRPSQTQSPPLPPGHNPK